VEFQVQAAFQADCVLGEDEGVDVEAQAAGQTDLDHVLAERTTIGDHVHVSGPDVGPARIAIELISWAEHTLVILDEHRLLGPGAHLQRPPRELLLHLRNRRMLSNRARTALKRNDRTATPGDVQTAGHH